MLSWLKTKSGKYEPLANDFTHPRNEENSANSFPHSCLLCDTINNHEESVQKFIKKAKTNHPEIDINKFKFIPICNLKTPKVQNSVTLTLNDIEDEYTKNHSEWNIHCQCFPCGPIFYDKLFKEEPFTRAVDIEEKRNYLKSKIIDIDIEPFKFEDDSDICIKTRKIILESLQTIINDLNFETNCRVINCLQKGLDKKIHGKISELKDELKVKTALYELQNEAFKMVLENDRYFKLYQMRLVIPLKCAKFSKKHIANVYYSIKTLRLPIYQQQ